MRTKTLVLYAIGIFCLFPIPGNTDQQLLYEVHPCEVRFIQDDPTFQAANNPAIEYGLLYVPCPFAYPDHAADPQDHPCDRSCNGNPYTRRFSLEEHDALVLFGWTIPGATYFSLMPYQACRVNPEGEPEATLSSIGLGLNHLTLKTNYGAPDSFRAFFALVVTADRQTASDVTQWMKHVGMPEEAINTYYLPKAFTNPDSTLNLVTRIIYPAEGTEPYLEHPPVKSYLFRYKGEGTNRELVESVPVWEDVVVKKDNEIQKITTPDDPTRPNYMEVFVQKIRDYYEQKEDCHLRVRLGAKLKHKDPEVCRADPPDAGACMHDNPDAVFVGFPDNPACSQAEDNSSGLCLINEAEAADDIIVMAAVNHSLFPGLAVSFASYTFNEFSPPDVDGMIGLQSFRAEEVLGSSQAYWSEDTKPAFIAVKIAADCDFDGDGSDDPYCIRIPASDDPSNAFYTMTGRIYLDMLTKTGPHPDNFVPARLLWFTGAGCRQ